MTGPAERDQVTHHLARKRLGNTPPFLISSAVCCVSRPAEVTWEGIIQGCRLYKAASSLRVVLTTVFFFFILAALHVSVDDFMVRTLVLPLWLLLQSL